MELRDEAVLVNGTTANGTQFEGEVRYGDLRPAPEKQWVHSDLYWSGVYVLSLSALAIYGLAFFLQSPDKGFFWWMAFVTAGVGLLMILAFQRKIEMVIYSSSAGVPMLVIMKVGPEKAKFESFVQELHARIRQAN